MNCTPCSSTADLRYLLATTEAFFLWWWSRMLSTLVWSLATTLIWDFSLFEYGISLSGETGRSSAFAWATNTSYCFCLASNCFCLASNCRDIFFCALRSRARLSYQALRGSYLLYSESVSRAVSPVSKPASCRVSSGRVRSRTSFSWASVVIIQCHRPCLNLIVTVLGFPLTLR